MSPKHWLLLLVALLAIGSLGVLLLEDGEEALNIQQETSSALATKRGADLPAAAPKPERIATSAFDPGQDAAEETPAEGPRGVLVVDPEGQPVAGAKVARLPSSRSRLFRFLQQQNQPQAALVSAVSNPAGLALFKAPFPRHKELVFRATKGTLAGFLRLAPDQEPLGELPEAVGVITLKATKELAIQVKDSAGLPAGDIQVQVREAGAGGPSGRFMRGGFGRPLTGWTEATSGRLTLKVTPEAGPIFDAQKLEVSALLVGQEAVRQGVFPKTDQVTKVDLVVPLCNTLKVTLKTNQGRLFKKPMTLSWSLLSANGKEDIQSFVRGFFRGAGRRHLRGGRARIGGLPLAGMLRLQPLTHTHVMTSTEVVLPTSPQILEADVIVGAQRPLLVVLLQEPEGGAAAKEHFRLRIQTEQGQQTASRADRRTRFRRRLMNLVRQDDRVRSDRQGRIRVRVDPDQSGTLLLFENQGGGGGFRWRGRGQEVKPLASLPFGALAPGQELDLGRVVLDRGPLLAGGRVLDAQGLPEKGLSVQIQIESATNGWRGPGRRGRQATSGDRGRFKIFGTPVAGASYQILAVGRGLLAAPLPFTPGTGDLELKVLRAGGLKGRVTRLHPELRLSVEIRAKPEGEVVARVRRGRPVRPAPDGHFALRHLLPGLYELEVRVQGRLERRFSGLTVVENRVAAPPALANIPVGQSYFAGQVQVQDAGGHPVAGARLLLRSEAEGERFRAGFRGITRTDKEGRGTLPVHAGADHLTLTVIAHSRQTTIKNPLFPLTVTLPRPVKVTVRFSSPLPKLPAATSYRLSFRRQAAGARGARGARGFGRGFRDRRSIAVQSGQESATFPSLDPGEWALSLEIRAGRDGPRGRRRASLALGKLKIEAGQEKQELAVSVEPAAIEGALAQAAALRRGR